MTTTSQTIEAQAATFRECFGHLKTEIGRVFVGQSELVDQLLLCFFCQGHALIEGPPGLGKTLLVKTLAEAVNLRFARVQCTPDLMPADVTGTNILLEQGGGARAFTFERGPIFANVVLADEINRATPRTQAAFLEAMQERRVTIFGVTHVIDDPFCVVATQNPIEMEGTYPLPEAQLDRFFFKLAVHVPDIDDLAEIMARTTGDAHATISPRFDPETLAPMLDLVRRIKIADDVLRFALRVVRATHPGQGHAPAFVDQYVRYGASPRAAQAIVLAAKARALLDRRYHASIDDVRHVVLPALNHRIILNFHGEMERVTTEAVIAQVLAAIA